MNRLLRMLALLTAITYGACENKSTGGLTPARDLTGQWTGSATFTNNCPNPACRWRTRLSPPSVILNLTQQGSTVTGTVTLSLGQGEVLVTGATCTSNTATGPITNGVVSGAAFNFRDPGGNLWNLGFTTDLMQGTVSNSAPGCFGLQASNVSLSRQ